MPKAPSPTPSSVVTMDLNASDLAASFRSSASSFLVVLISTLTFLTAYSCISSSLLKVFSITVTPLSKITPKAAIKAALRLL